MRKSHYLLLVIAILFGMFLAACGGSEEAAPVEEAAPAKEEAAPAEEEAAPAEKEAGSTEEEAAPVEEEAAPTEEAPVERVQIRWFVGLDTGTEPEQVAVQEKVVEDFNNSQDLIELVLEIVPYQAAKDTLATQIASGGGPDIIGPVNVGGSNAFYGQFLNMRPYIESSDFDLSIFDPALVEFYQTEEGQVGLPFAVFPGAMYFIPEIFDEAGLAYPPQTYGEQYKLDGKMVDWNWDTVTEVAKRLTIDINGANATEEGFDPNQIIQVGYTPQWQDPQSVATFYGGAHKIFSGNAPGSYESTIPDSWKEAWRWWYEGMYGDQPYIDNGPLGVSAEFGNGNTFNTGKSAMGLSMMWYTCCMFDLRDAGYEFQAGVQPMDASGVVNGRVDAFTFRIWSGTDHPEEAFDALSYLITTGGDKLLPIYGAMPAIASKTEAFIEKKSADYPSVTEESWDVFIQGLAYPDSPSAEQYVPNWNEGYARILAFGDLLKNTPDLDFDVEFDKLQGDLTVIYNKE